MKPITNSLHRMLAMFGLLSHHRRGYGRWTRQQHRVLRSPQGEINKRKSQDDHGGGTPLGSGIRSEGLLPAFRGQSGPCNASRPAIAVACPLAAEESRHLHCGDAHRAELRSTLTPHRRVPSACVWTASAALRGSPAIPTLQSFLNSYYGMYLAALSSTMT